MCKTMAAVVALSAVAARCGCHAEESCSLERWRPREIRGHDFYAEVYDIPWVTRPETAPDLAMLRHLIIKLGWGDPIGLNDIAWFSRPMPEKRRMKNLPYSVWDFLGIPYKSNRLRYLLQWYHDHRPDVPVYLGCVDSWFPWFMKDDYEADVADFDEWRSTYTNFAGFVILNESDGSIGSFNSRKAITNEAMRAEVDRALPPAGSYADKVRWLERIMARQKSMHFGCTDFRSLYSGNCKWGHALAKYGVGMLGYECEMQILSAPWRFGMCHVRGAARQYALPFSWYSAHLIIGHTRDGRRVQGEWELPNRQWPKVREKLGAARSLLKRNYFYGYMGGATSLGIEKPNHFFYDDREDPVGKPTRYALDFNAIFELAEKTPRGIPYTPVLALTSVYEGFTRCGFNYRSCRDMHAVNSFYYTLVPTLTEDGYTNRDTKKGFQGCLFNSEFGEILDVMCPDAAQPTAEFAEAIAPYKWAFLVGGFDKTDFDRRAVADWVKAGGTLVVSEDTVRDGLVAESLAGVKLTAKTVASGKTLCDANGRKIEDFGYGYTLRLADAKGAKPFLRDELGNIVAYTHDAGRGRVVLVTAYQMIPDYFIDLEGKDYFFGMQKLVASGRAQFPIVKHLLRVAQEETMPVRVEGDIQWGVNLVEDGDGSVRWLVWLMNNKGVTKFQFEDEQLDPRAAARVKVTLKSSGETVERVVGPGAFDFFVMKGAMK